MSTPVAPTIPAGQLQEEPEGGRGRTEPAERGAHLTGKREPVGPARPARGRREQGARLGIPEDRRRRGKADLRTQQQNSRGLLMGPGPPGAGLGGAGDFLLLSVLCALTSSSDDLMDLRCFRPGQNSDMNCTWTHGRNRTTDTIYTLYYHSLKYHSGLPPPLANASVPRGQSWVVIARENLMAFNSYKVWVEGVSGSSHTASQHLQIDTQAIVLLSPPSLSVEQDAGSDSCNVMVFWQPSILQHGNNPLRCELWYREVGAENWTQVTFEGEGSCSSELLELTHFRLYEVQARYLPVEGNNPGSDWSEPLRFRSPEAAPLGTLDVWRSLEDGGSRLLVMWKALDPSAARSHNLTYTLSYRERGGSGHVARWVPCCNTSLPGTVEYISIAANNSIGQTQPANLSLEYSDLPAPAQFQVQRIGGQALNVSWDRSEIPMEEPQEYLVEWRSAEWGGAGGVHWKRQLASRVGHSILLTGESFQAEMPYLVTVYALYPRGYGGSNCSLCYMQEGVPSRGPNVSISGLSATKALVTLGEIPLMERRGLITHYTIYVIRGASQEVYNVSVTGNVTVSKLEPSTHYQLRVTASTSAGEGPGSIYPFLTPGTSLVTAIASMVTVFLVVCCVLGLVFHRRIHRLGWAVLPKFCWQEIPDPVHSRLVLKAPNCKDVDEWHSFCQRIPELSTGSEEPPISVVEELEEPLQGSPTAGQQRATDKDKEGDGHLSDSLGTGSECRDAASVDPAGSWRGVEAHPPVMSGYEKHFMPSSEDLQRFT